MAELLVNFTEPTRSTIGDLYYAQALGRVAPDGLWEGWIEFVRAGDDEVVRTSRETEQPSRDHLRYWAQGLTQTYLEGALERALSPTPAVLQVETRVFVDSAPRPPLRPVVGRSQTVVLDPFQVYAEGEDLLRKQLLALSRDHVRNIVEAYGFAEADNPDWVRTASHAVLADRVVDRVRERFESTVRGTAPAAEAGQQTSTEAHPPS